MSLFVLHFFSPKKEMNLKKYSVIVRIICAWLVVYFVQGFENPKPTVKINTEEGKTGERTGHIGVHRFEIPYSTVRMNTEEGTTDETTGHRGVHRHELPHSNVRVNIEEGTTDLTTDHTVVPQLEIPAPSVPNKPIHTERRVVGTKTKEKASLMKVVQNTIYQLCPYGQFCSTSSPNMSSDEKPCCTDCSCNESCSDEENKVCCFPKRDLPETVNVKQMECLTATFSQRSLPNSVLLPRYNMVTVCPPTTHFESLEENKILVESCKDNTLIQSLQPVFSKTTKLIYKNKFCAQCHEETRFISWTPYLICTGESIQVDISKAFLSSNCYIRFKYPGDLLDIQFHRCCLPTFSYLPTKLSLDHDTVEHLCEHSIYAPFSYINEGIEEIFVNVYCAMCSSNFLEEEITLCTKANTEIPRTMGIYIGTLDISVLDDGGENNVMDTKKTKMEACRMLDSKLLYVGDGHVKKVGSAFTDPKEYVRVVTSYKGIPNSYMQMLTTDYEDSVRTCNKNPCVCEEGEQTCRQLFCESGQVLNQAGQCVYVSLYWVIENAYVLLKLSLGADFTDCSIYNHLESKDLLSQLNSAWLKSGTIHSFFTGTSLCNCTRRLVTKCDPYIVVVYSTKYYKQSNQTFPEFLIGVRKLLSEPWFLQINGSSVRLTSELLNLHSVKDDALWYLRNDPYYLLPYVTMSVPLSSFHITKLFYCEQISLHDLEYDMYTLRYGQDNYIFIHTPEQGKIFLPSEYVLHKRVDGSVYPRVCVTDTLYQKGTKSNAGH